MAELLGSVCDSGFIDVAIWRHVLDPATGVETHSLKRECMRTAMDVAKDLYAKLNVMKCDQCGEEKPLPKRGYAGDLHKDCPGKNHCLHCGPACDLGVKQGEWFSVIDEYFHGPGAGRDNFTIPQDYRRVICFPVTGGSEGHYWHVGVLCPDPSGQGPLIYREIALGKTFRGWDYCCWIASRCAQLLGA